jgi:hypothetical protein
MCFFPFILHKNTWGVCTASASSTERKLPLPPYSALISTALPVAKASTNFSTEASEIFSMRVAPFRTNLIAPETLSMDTKRHELFDVPERLAYG